MMRLASTSMDEHTATLASHSSASPASAIDAENAGGKKPRKAPQRLTPEQFVEAADMLAAGHLRREVMDHFNVAHASLDRHVTGKVVEQARLRRAERIAAGLEVLPEVKPGRKERQPRAQRVVAPEPVVLKPVAAKQPATSDTPKTKRGEAQQKLQPPQQIEAADMLAAGHSRVDVAKHFEIHFTTLYARVKPADVAEAKTRRAGRIAAGLEVIPEVARKRAAKAEPRSPKPGTISRAERKLRREEREADKAREKGRRKAIKDHTKLRDRQRANLAHIDAQYLALSEKIAALRANIATLEGEQRDLRRQRDDVTLSVPPLDLSAFNKPAPAPVAPPAAPATSPDFTSVASATPAAAWTDQQQTTPNPAAAKPVPLRNIVHTALDTPVGRPSSDDLPKAMSLPALPGLPLVQNVQDGQLRTIGFVERPAVPQSADLLVVPLTAAGTIAAFRQQHQPPYGWSPGELWNGFLAVNRNLHEAHQKAEPDDPLIDRMMRRYAIQRYTPERLAAEGDDFIRTHRAEKFPGLVREVFLLVSHRKHVVLGEVWQDHKAGHGTPQTTFVLDPKLAERPALDNLMVLLPDVTGKGQKYRAFTPTKATLAPE